jgi:hypothetical protein
MSGLGHKLLGIVLSGVKAFFSAVVQIAWGIASFFLMMGLLTYYKADPSAIAILTYYKADPSAIANLIPIVSFIQQNWLYFFWVLAIYDFIVYLKDFLRPVYAEMQIQTPQATKSKEKQL